MIRPAPSISSEELAALLRDQILSGELAPGARIPSDRWLCETHDVSRGLVRLAKAILRSEGLVVTRQGKTSRVRPLYDKEPIDLTNVVQVETRMPTAPERERLDDRLSGGFDDGVPVFVVWRLDPDEPESPPKPELLPGDRWMLPGPAHA
ncbi:winged helix-turn-helix domain-containing protein [Micromonospora sp. NPDC048935]|uniref:winged helix-turn-helix domain-containing protein n=1 Tax=Micromonospora sp. NPDC048935 TaxID=3364262 RepID=UPI0037168205